MGSTTAALRKWKQISVAFMGFKGIWLTECYCWELFWINPKNGEILHISVPARCLLLDVHQHFANESGTSDSTHNILLQDHAGKNLALGIMQHCLVKQSTWTCNLVLIVEIGCVMMSLATSQIEQNPTPPSCSLQVVATFATCCQKETSQDSL